VDWIHLAQSALKLQAFVKAVLNLRVRVNVETVLPTVTITIFLSVTLLLNWNFKDVFKTFVPLKR